MYKKTSKGIFWLFLTLLIFISPVKPVHAAQGDKCSNMIFIWTDNKILKAVTLMTFEENSGRVDILSIPVFTHINNCKESSIEDLYQKEGLSPLIKKVESSLGITMNGYMTFDQQVLMQASALIGPFKVNNQSLSMIEAFEATRNDARCDDQDIIRALAKRVTEPICLVRIPQLMWIFTTQVETNLNPRLYLQVYRVVHKNGSTILTKKALPGKDYYLQGKKYRYVEPLTWKTILPHLTSKHT